MKKSFGRDYSAILSEKDRIKDQREKPVSVSSISGKQPLSVLEELVLMWPTHDLRYTGEYPSSYEDEELMEDMIRSAEVRVTRKDITKGILEVTVSMIQNLDEVERYNAAVSAHNREWVDQGSPTTLFDPMTGDVLKVKDQFVDPVLMQSKHYNLPKSAYSDVSSGKLARARPGIARKSHLKVRYQMRITDEGKFVIGYAAYDYNSQIIYYNEVTHKNLAYLVRRSVQEIWGNPTAADELDDLLDGVTMLINGKKLAICKKNNKLPEFLAHEKTSVKDTRSVLELEADEERMIVSSNVASFYMPIVFIIGFVICLFASFFNMGSQREELALGDILPLLLCILFLFGTYFCREIAQGAERNASELGAKKKFL